MLFYNDPAAIESSGDIFVGYSTNDGSVIVSQLTKDGALERNVLVHKYAGPDDHLSPALALSGGQLLVATSQHSGDLFLYSLDDNSRRLLCHWTGRFTYPRFERVDGKLRLYVRTDDGKTGDLAQLNVDESCAPPAVIFAAPTGQWLYATQPSHGSFAWSLYDEKTKHYPQTYRDGRRITLEQSSLPEQLPFSVAGDYLSVTRFRGSYRCCNTDEMIPELYRGDRRIYTGAAMPTPYYPAGIVLRPDHSEGLFPVKSGFRRLSLPRFSPLPTCWMPNSINALKQYVKGGDGAYIWVAFDKYGERDLSDATLYLCLPAAKPAPDY